MRNFIILLLLFSSVLYAHVAQVVALKGKANIIRDGSILDVKISSKLLELDELKTLENTKIQLLFKDETIVSLGENSNFSIKEYLYEENSRNVKTKFKFTKGFFRVITGKIGKLSPKKFKLETKVASMGIRGTQILLHLHDDKEDIFCIEGAIYVQKANEKPIDLDAGKSLRINIKTNEIKLDDINEEELESIQVLVNQSEVIEEKDSSSYDDFIAKKNELNKGVSTDPADITKAINDKYQNPHILKYTTSVSGYIEEKTDGKSNFDNDTSKLNNAKFTFEIDFAKAKNNNPVKASFSVKTPSNSWVKGVDNSDTFTGNISDKNSIILNYKNASDVAEADRTINIKNSNLDISGTNVELRSHSQNEKILIEKMELTPKE